MSSKIEWTGNTWNPIRARNKANGNIGHFCAKISAGCKHCYAERMQKWPFMNPIRYSVADDDKVDLFLDPDVLMQPARWRKPTTIFPCSMTDLFLEHHPFEWIDTIFRVMADCDRHIFQVLTKRPDRALEFCRWKRELLGAQWFMPENVWFGTSVEDQPAADRRIPLLLQIPASTHWLSCEPLLGPLNLHKWIGSHFIPEGFVRFANIDWLVAGGESGHGARPMHPDWVRSLRDQCAAASVAFFFKQWGEYAGDGSSLWSAFNHPTHPPEFHYEIPLWKVGKKAAGRLLDGVEHNGMPILHTTPNIQL